jgi:hypothetical protein
MGLDKYFESILIFYAKEKKAYVYNVIAIILHESDYPSFHWNSVK